MAVDCEQCKMTIPNYVCLAQHYLNVHNDNYMSERAGKCEICRLCNPHNIRKHKRFRTPEKLQAHVKSQHKTDLPAQVKAWCVYCKEKFDYFYELKEHYLTKHNDTYRSKYCGICDICSMVAEAGCLTPGGTPNTVYPTYNALKTHWQQAHLSGLTKDAKQRLKENKLGLTRGSM